MKKEKQDETSERPVEVAAAPAVALDTPRTILLRDPKTRALYTWHMRRITGADWKQYFMGIVHQTLNEGETRSQVYDSESALVELVTRAVDRVEGYGPTVAGKWREWLPERHRLAVGMALRGVGAAEDSGTAELLAELVEVKLDATWSAVDETMQLIRGLVHRFRHPSIEQLKRYNFEMARVRTSGTAESGITIHPSRQLVAMNLYDELIDSVDGYTVQDSPLTDVETIRREMDGLHKATAALELFGKNEVAIV
jgi:hypothetical protein